jgi:hypothetical protein
VATTSDQFVVGVELDGDEILMCVRENGEDQIWVNLGPHPCPPATGLWLAAAALDNGHLTLATLMLTRSYAAHRRVIDLWVSNVTCRSALL